MKIDNYACTWWPLDIDFYSYITFACLKITNLKLDFLKVRHRVFSTYRLLGMFDGVK